MCKSRFLKVFGPNVKELGSLVQLKLGTYYVYVLLEEVDMYKAHCSVGYSDAINKLSLMLTIDNRNLKMEP